MSLHRRSNSSNWYYAFQASGKRYFGTTGTQNKTKAMQVEREIRNKVHGENFLGESESISLQMALTKYVEARKNLSYYKGMESISRKIVGHKIDSKTKEKLPCYGLSVDIKLHELQTKDIERLVQRRKAEGDKPATIKHEIGLIRSTMGEMRKLGYRVNRDIIFPTLKTTYRLRYLDSREEEALLRELHPETLRDGLKSLKSRTSEMHRNLYDNYELVVFLLDTGCRYSEAANIPWSAINLEQGIVSLYRTKVSNEGVLYMTARLKAILTCSLI